MLLILIIYYLILLRQSFKIPAGFICQDISFIVFMILALKSMHMVTRILITWEKFNDDEMKTEKKARAHDP